MQGLREHLSQWLRLAMLYTGLADLVFAVLSSIWIESQKYLSVLERVLLLDTSSLCGGIALRLLQYRLNFARVDQSIDISVADKVGWQQEILLVRRRLAGRAVDIIQSLECIRGPDDESAEMTAWSQLQKVESSDRGCLDTWNVSECSHKLLAIGLGVVDNERTSSLSLSSSS